MLTINKQIYVGFSILELSKLLMYKFHYDYVCNKYDAKLLFTETGSLLIVKMFMNSVLKIKDCLILVVVDCSRYPMDSKYYDSTNKKFVGKMKD